MPTNRIFIKAAEIILKQEGAPLNVEIIIEKAFESGELATNGKTPLNTMRARLSEHIRKYKEESTFIRISPNVFGLREWNLKEYDDNPMVKKYAGEYVVCVAQSTINKTGRFFGFSSNYQQYLESFQGDNLKFLDRAEIENNDGYKQLIAYVMLFNQKGEILSFTRGKYSTANKQLLEGAICIGFGGHVNKLDYMGDNNVYRLFSYLDSGIKQASIREIGEELQDIRIDFESLKYIGLINDDSSPTGLRHIGFVLKGSLPTSFDIDHINTERSISKLRFLTEQDLWRHFHELEFWSQILCKKYWKEPSTFNPVVISNGKKKIIEGPISIVGEVATGKTLVANYLSERYGIPVVTTRLCVADLIGEKDFRNGRRDIFSQKAENYVSTEEGILNLANRIITEIQKAGKKIVILDGIRKLKTNEIIRRKYPLLTTIFIDSPRDKAYQLYRYRMNRKATIDEFRITRSFEVEKEVTLFKNRADIRIYNGGTKEELISGIKDWFDERIQISV